MPFIEYGSTKVEVDVHQPGNCVAEQFVSPVVAWKLAGLPKPDNMIINILQGETPD